MKKMKDLAYHYGLKNANNILDKGLEKLAED